MFRLAVRLLAALGMSLSSAAAMDSGTVRQFHDAVHAGDIGRVKTMLSGMPKLATSVGEFKFQPIHLLDMYFEREILDLLLANGADINARNDEGVTILHIVTDPDAVTILVQHGADTESRDIRSWTPLIIHAGEQQNGPDVVEALLANGANPNAKGNKGETALSIARATGDKALIEILIGAGAKD